MPVNNPDIARTFDKIADFLEIKGENIFRVRAYRNAALVIAGLGRSAADMAKDGEDFSRLPGIGKDLAAKIEEMVKTGRLKFLEKLEKDTPPGLIKMLSIQGLGPHRVKALYEKLRIKDIDGLKRAALAKKVRALEGFGEKTEETILREIERVKGVEGQMKLADAEEIALPLLEYIKKAKGVKKVVPAGSFRRAKESVRDLDILVTCDDCSNVMKRFIKYEDVDKVVSHGETRSTVILRCGLQVDMRAVPEKSYGSALCYLTGSQAHNIELRRIAKNNRLKLNEYGVFRAPGPKKEEWIAGRTEEEVYKKLGLPYIEPELREDRGEIEAAKKGTLPHLITPGDIKGDLHVHTNITDGHNTLEEMVRAARGKGYKYIGITEHSQHVKVAHGLDEKATLERIRELERFNNKIKGITILKGMEVDILEDGRLDLEDNVLKELDFTVCAVHYKFNLTLEKQTERIIRAMDNPYFHILAHPTGRLIHERDPYEVDMDRIILAAKDRGCILELNGHPLRLDLNDIHCKLAKESGVKIAISTDAHNAGDLGYMRFGVLQARRGWLEPKDIINTRSEPELRKLLKRK
ncbi:MAG: DNA polymerase/3'-5' exonuclease PolX [Candidatus Omnitrophota bacterium]|nr:DNA polymerase/3'-5' exonuclease PolX [Candidatus Omnitrophota bacterium]